MQRGARSFFCRNAPMQRGAHFLISDFPFGVLCWAQRGRQKHCKTNAFLLFLKMKGAPGAATKWIPKSKTCKNSRKIHVFRKCLGGSLASTLGGHYFCLHILRPQDGPVEGIVFIEKLMLFYMFWENSRSHAACRSFGSAPPRHYYSVSGIHETSKTV